jgi:hypothetical protein
MMLAPLFPPPILRTRLLPARWGLARCWVHAEAAVYLQCCPGGCGVGGGAGAESWRVRKEGLALRAEEVWVGVWGEVECGWWEVGVAGEGVV